jgi:hypothetical protein
MRRRLVMPRVRSPKRLRRRPPGRAKIMPGTIYRPMRVPTSDNPIAKSCLRNGAVEATVWNWKAKVVRAKNRRASMCQRFVSMDGPERDLAGNQHENGPWHLPMK